MKSSCNRKSECRDYDIGVYFSLNQLSRANMVASECELRLKLLLSFCPPTLSIWLSSSRLLHGVSKATVAPAITFTFQASDQSKGQRQKGSLLNKVPGNSTK